MTSKRRDNRRARWMVALGSGVATAGFLVAVTTAPAPVPARASTLPAGTAASSQPATAAPPPANVAQPRLAPLPAQPVQPAPAPRLRTRGS